MTKPKKSYLTQDSTETWVFLPGHKPISRKKLIPLPEFSNTVTNT